MNRLRKTARPLLHLLLATFTAMSLYAPVSQAAVIGTEQLLGGLDQPQQTLATRDSVKQQLSLLGVDNPDIQMRIDTMSTQELSIMAERMEQLPAGQGGAGILLTVFLVLLLTDILGYTDIFPFVKSHH